VGGCDFQEEDCGQIGVKQNVTRFRLKLEGQTGETENDAEGNNETGFELVAVDVEIELLKK
jgi:hypothetical protein